MRVNVVVMGCDDETNFSIEATPAEFAFLERVADLCSATSRSGCQPVMSVSIEDAPQEDSGAPGNIAQQGQ